MEGWKMEGGVGDGRWVAWQVGGRCTCGTPFFCRSTPVIVKRPSSLHASVEARSPSYTTTSTSVCQSSVVVNVSALRHGIAVLRFTIVDITLPWHSIPRLSGTTSISTRVELALASAPPAASKPPLSTPACQTYARVTHDAKYASMQSYKVCRVCQV